MEPAATTYDLIVIGGGASGMMAAIVAAEQHKTVLLIEKNKRLGEKLRITGGGRCNITNAEEDIRLFLKKYQKAEQFLYSPFSQFNNADTMAFFEDIKLPLKVEANKRVFPASDQASDVIHVLINRLHRLGVTLLTKATVTGITMEDSHITSVQVGKTSYTARHYVLATGGLSRPETGSTGDGFGWLRALGHTVRKPTPSITPLAIKESWIAHAAGVTVHEARITFYGDEKRAFSLHGSILFTHFGISGPLILNAAYRVGELLEKGSVTALIDLFPNLDTKTLDTSLVNVLNENGTKQLKNVLPLIAPHGLAALTKERCLGHVSLETKCSEVSKEQRQILVGILKELPFTIDKLMGYEKAVVADGGVSLKEVDTRTMRSKKIANLYITGDMLDITRPSGGYSLQLCWTSGYVAAMHASQS
jgi:predicted Rossmann fold flavoprotein